MKALLAFGLAISFVFVFLNGSAQAANFDFQVLPSLVSICPCNSVTPQQVQVSIKNLYQFPDTYSFVITAPPGFTAQIQQNLVVNPGDTRTLDLLLVDVGCNVVPADYQITIKASSGSTGELQTKSLGLDVLNCYELSLTADSKYQEVCSESNRTAIYYLKLQNNGRYSDTYTLSSSVSWAIFSESSIVVEAGKSKTVAMALMPPAGTSGLQTLNVQAKSSTFSVSDSETFQMNILDCYAVAAELQPTETSACLGQIVDQKVTITNTGLRNDTYTILLPSWINATKPVISIDAKRSADVFLLLQPGQKGRTSYNITVVSANDPSLRRVLPSSVTVQECKGVAVIASPADATVCQNVGADFIISIKNMGTLVDVFNLTTTMGVLDLNKVTVNPEDTKQVQLRISNISAPGTYKAKVTAQSGDVSDSDTVNVAVENCYGASMDISPQSQSICSGSAVNYTVNVKNTGKLTDTYTLRMESQLVNVTRQISLGPGEVRPEYFMVQTVSDAQAKDYPIKFTLQSARASVTSQSILTVKPKSSCYSVQLTTDDRKYVQICNASALPVTVKNTGQSRETFALKVDGPTWAYISPNSVQLDGGQQQLVYVYLTPCYNAETKPYQISISASSLTSQAQKAVAVNVVANLSGVPSGGNQTPGGNQTGGNVTGNLILGLDSNGWKLVAIVVITVVIIIILAIRFVLLAKK